MSTDWIEIFLRLMQHRFIHFLRVRKRQQPDRSSSHQNRFSRKTLFNLIEIRMLFSSVFLDSCVRSSDIHTHVLLSEYAGRFSVSLSNRGRKKSHSNGFHLGLPSAQISYIPAVGLQTPTLTPAADQRFFEYPLTPQPIPAAAGPPGQRSMFKSNHSQ